MRMLIAIAAAVVAGSFPIHAEILQNLRNKAHPSSSKQVNDTIIESSFSLQTPDDILKEISASLDNKISYKGSNFDDNFSPSSTTASTKSTDNLDVSLSSSSNIAVSNFGLQDGEIVGGIRMYEDSGNPCAEYEGCPDATVCCFKQSKRFCIHPLEAAAVDPGTECKYPQGSVVYCADASVCGDKEKCEEGRCKLDPSLYACSLCTDQKWIGCFINPQCPSGYYHLRWDNGPCTWGWKRRVCRREWNCRCKKCGNHYATSCKWCPYTNTGANNGRTWCNGDCKWMDNKCVDR